jgi:hypothetical protein
LSRLCFSVLDRPENPIDASVDVVRRCPPRQLVLYLLFCGDGDTDRELSAGFDREVGATCLDRVRFGEMGA